MKNIRVGIGLLLLVPYFSIVLLISVILSTFIKFKELVRRV